MLEDQQIRDNLVLETTKSFIRNQQVIMNIRNNQRITYQHRIPDTYQHRSPFIYQERSPSSARIKSNRQNQKLEMHKHLLLEIESIKLYMVLEVLLLLHNNFYLY